MSTAVSWHLPCACILAWHLPCMFACMRPCMTFQHLALNMHPCMLANLSCRSNSLAGWSWVCLQHTKEKVQVGTEESIDPTFLYTGGMWVLAHIYSKVNHFYRCISICRLVSKSLFLKPQLSRETVYRSSATVVQYQSTAMQVGKCDHGNTLLYTIYGFEMYVQYINSLCQDRARMYVIFGRNRAARKCI